MRINHLDLSNFRCFKERSFAFHQRFTLLIGANATGKTAILDALAVALGAALIPVPHAPNGPIRYRDVRRTHHPIGETGHFTEHYPVRVEARGSIEDRDQAPRSHRSTSGPAGKDRARTETPGVVLIDEMLDDDDDDNPKTFPPLLQGQGRPSRQARRLLQLL